MLLNLAIDEATTDTVQIVSLESRYVVVVKVTARGALVARRTRHAIDRPVSEFWNFHAQARIRWFLEHLSREKSLFRGARADWACQKR